MLNGMNG